MGETYTPEVDAHRAGSEQDERRSDSWPGSEPSVSVVIPTHQRAGYLEELLEVLTEQTIGVPRFEVIVCDDGSTDDTWAVLEKATDHSPLRLCALRQAVSSGPSRARNLACSRARAPLIAFTDDDCLPTPGWLAAVLEAFADADVVQGAVRGDPRAERVAGPWDKTLWVTGPTPWFETANISYRRELFERLGGFVEDDGVSRRPGGMAFGEDCLLGARALDAGGRRVFAEAALVHHRYLPGTFADYLESRRRLVGFPALARQSAPIRAHLQAGVFLTRRSAAFDLAVAGAVVATLRRRPRWLLAGLWYLRTAWPDARRRRSDDGGPVRRLAQLAYGDAVGLTWLLRGTARHRRAVL